jgi:hypothetical protein
MTRDGFDKLRTIILKSHFSQQREEFSEFFGSEATNIIQARADILRLGRRVFKEHNTTPEFSKMFDEISSYA